MTTPSRLPRALTIAAGLAMALLAGVADTAATASDLVAGTARDATVDQQVYAELAAGRGAGFLVHLTETADLTVAARLPAGPARCGASSGCGGRGWWSATSTPVSSSSTRHW